MLKCKDCKKYMESATKGHGFCSLPESFFPTEAENDCHYIVKQSLKCEDCDRLGTDYACFTAKAEDDASNCPGFIDKDESELENILIRMFSKGKYSKEKIIEFCDKFEESEMFKLLKDHVK